MNGGIYMQLSGELCKGDSHPKGCDMMQIKRAYRTRKEKSMGKVQVIPQKQKKSVGEKKKTMRVAAYCRVSRDTEQQQNSYESQVSFYTKYITEHEDWSLAGIYADDGISGLSTDKRSDFMRLIDDCKEGKIDLIITKSISRFARNLLDCVGYARKLKKMGIGVFFEEEHFSTLDDSAEFILTILGAVAQQESINISQHVNAGLEHKYASGSVKQNCRNFLGYDYDLLEKRLVVNPEQAKTVVRIFNEFLDGKSLRQICDSLEKDKIPTGAGGMKWVPCTVERTLKNEKYMGDARLQKTFTTDILEKRRKRNEGDLKEYCYQALMNLKEKEVAPPAPLTYPEFRQDFDDPEYQERLKLFAKERMDNVRTSEILKFIKLFPENRIRFSSDDLIPRFVKKIIVCNTSLTFYFYGDVEIRVERY